MLIVTNFEFTQLFRESVLSWRAHVAVMPHKDTIWRQPVIRRIFAAETPVDLREL